MIKAILAVDDKGGVSKNGSMPWPRNLKDLEWFKKNTLNHIVIMGKKTWIDPKMPTPLKERLNKVDINYLHIIQMFSFFVIDKQMSYSMSYSIIFMFSFPSN